MFFSVRRGRKNNIKIITGKNSVRRQHTGIPISTHAEIDALQKLKFKNAHKTHPIKMNLMVVRFSKTGVLGNAEPCFHCMKQLARAEFVNIKNVYYSDSEKIVCKKFQDMVTSPTHFISSGYRNRMKITREEMNK